MTKQIIALLLVLVGLVMSQQLLKMKALRLLEHPKLSDLARKELWRNIIQQSGSTVDILIHMKDTVKLASFKSIKDVDVRAKILVDRLVQLASQTQEPLMSIIQPFATAHSEMQVKRFWIQNSISIVNCHLELIELLLNHESVAKISSNRQYPINVPEQEQMLSNQLSIPSRSKSPSAVEWNIEWIQSPKLWEKQVTGKGIVVGVADTGVQYDHPALVKKYRGLQGDGQFDHNYNWHDAIQHPISGGSRCGYNVSHPCDDYGHGTHCTGTTVGSTAERVIGNAIDAKWIACRNMDAGNGRPSTYIDCLQFMMAPTNLAGEKPDVNKRAHVVSNSYGCEKSEHCEPDSLKDAVDAMEHAGVFMAVAAGNSGPSCSSCSTGPGIYQTSFSVGALGFKTNEIAGFSSRGPVTSDGSNRRKPDICAPGVNIISSYPTNTYTSMSGTSMATPHIAGCVALLWSGVPKLVRNIEETRAALQKSTIPRPVTNVCSSSGAVNNVYGYGVVQVFNAYTAAMNSTQA